MKGGVGKTTIAAQLAFAADSDGLRVLAMDLDPQSNLSQSILGPSRYASDVLKRNHPTIVQVFEGYIPSDGTNKSPKVIKPTDAIIRKAGGADGTLDLIASRLELSRTLKHQTDNEQSVANIVAAIGDQYDLVTIDCAPTESILTEAAYFASRYIVVPVKLEFLATVGLPLLERSVRDFRSQNQDHQLEIAGMVVNDHSEYSSNEEKETALGEVREFACQNDWLIYKSQIPYSRSYPKASRNGLALSRTPNAQWDRIQGFKSLKEEIFCKHRHSRMTNASETLTLRTKLLIAEYGRKKVIAALAKVEGVEYEVIDREIDMAKTRKPNVRRRKKTLANLLEEANIDQQTYELVEQVALAYQNKHYLPQLCKVRMFLESYGVDANKFRTRISALPKFIEVLGSLDEEQLADLANSLNKSTEHGDLRTIADAILRSAKRV